VAKQTIEPASRVAVDTAVRARNQKHEGTVSLSTGVMIRVRPVANLIVADIARGFPEPKPPKVYIEEKAREDVNPNDPDYLKALNDRQTEMAMAINDAFLLMGTEIISVPDDVPKVEDAAWVARLAILGIKSPEDEYSRYLAWLKYIAAPLATDVIALIRGVGDLSAVSEDEVQAVADGFRREDAGRTDLSGPTK